MKKGIVYLVGAGPGDVELLTLKARRLIGEAEVIVYDNLVNRQIITMANEKAELLYVGKKPGAHSSSQEEINRLLVEYALKGRSVVRLKGGDPFVFGRGGEEVLALEEKGIDFEIVPGITAGVAACAYGGIPVTHRGLATAVTFVTGHEAADKGTGEKGEKTSSIRWDKLALASDTLVFYMGVKNISLISEKLIKHGLNETTPAAVIHRGTTTAQRVVTGTLGTIAALVKEQNISSPSIIVVGKVAGLQKKMNWFGKNPLFNRGIVTTRNSSNDDRFQALIQKRGGRVIGFPVIEITTRTFEENHRTIINTLDQYEWIVFTSKNGVCLFFDSLYKAGYDVRRFGRIKIAAIGPGTARALEEYALKPDLIPDDYVSEDLAETLIKRDNPAGKKILIARSALGRKVLTDRLSQAGALVNDIPLYDIKKAEVTAEQKEALFTGIENGEVDWITFTSASCGNNFFSLMDKEDKERLHNLRSRFKIGVIGPVTARAVVENGFTVDYQAEEYTFKGLLSGIEKKLIKK